MRDSVRNNSMWFMGIWFDNNVQKIDKNVKRPNNNSGYVTCGYVNIIYLMYGAGLDSNVPPISFMFE
jgi:hypothetical protein